MVLLTRVPGSLPFRFGVLFACILVGAALAVGYLFDRGRTAALQERELEHLGRHAERGADEISHAVSALRGDVLFLADTPPIQGIRRALEAGGRDPTSGSSLVQWQERLQQIFLAFAASRPDYFQLRLIGAAHNGLELVRVDRTADGPRVMPADALQPKADRYYFREAAALPPRSVYFSRIDLNQEHGRIVEPLQPTLRVATPVHDPRGGLFGVVIINMDMGRVLERLEHFTHRTEAVYVVDERGEFISHPEPGRAFAFELGPAKRFADEFPTLAERLAATGSSGEAFVETLGPDGETVAYVTSRAFDPADPERRLVVILLEPAADVFEAVGLARRETLIRVGGLLALAVVLVAGMALLLTRSLRQLSRAAEAIAGGRYPVTLPVVGGGEVGTLAAAFRRMAAEVEKRETALADLNLELEGRVEQRTRDLARQHALQRLILDNIADGVVVTDQDGRFLLWNRKAEQIVGSGPKDVGPEHWAPHYGVYWDESGSPVPTDELPLVRAMHGESTDNVELFLRNPGAAEGRWVQVTARPLVNEQGLNAGAVAALVDVTERRLLRRRLEEHRSELSRVGQLALTAEIAASATHQLSQPIAAISAFAGAAVRLRTAGRLDEAGLTGILERIDRLSRQSGEVLEGLRSLIRRRSLVPAPIDLNAVADTCLDLLRERIEQYRVRVDRDYAPDLPMPVGDTAELEQVLLQIMNNALEAMDQSPSGTRRLSIRTRRDIPDDRVLIELADTGRGVRRDILDSVFEPWVTDKVDALGIGLSIAQTIIERLGGQIRMRSTVRGTRVTVELPASPGAGA